MNGHPRFPKRAAWSFLIFYKCIRILVVTDIFGKKNSLELQVRLNDGMQ